MSKKNKIKELSEKYGVLPINVSPDVISFLIEAQIANPKPMADHYQNLKQFNIEKKALQGKKPDLKKIMKSSLFESFISAQANEILRQEIERVEKAKLVASVSDNQKTSEKKVAPKSKKAKP